MIRAEELMLDDWVVAYGKKTQVVWTGNVKKLAVRGFPSEFFEDEILPIPITPEILEENGFTPIYHDDKSAYKWKEYDDDDNYQSVIIDFKVKWTCEVWNSKAKKSYKGEILCLHELQHIMKICGINKTIEL